MAEAQTPTEDWQALPWKQFQRNVYRLQKRILPFAQDKFYQAERRGDYQRVRNLQRLPYWATRLGRNPELPRRVTTLLQRQNGSCPHCGLRFMATDVLEVHHLDGNHRNNRYSNWALLHGHCHDQAHGTRFR